MAEQDQNSANDVCYFAVTNFRGQNRKFGIRTDDRRRHMYVIGKTGMGKSTMLENMIVQDIREGRGVGVVDPHGDLAEKIIDYIPSHRVNDVIYLNPADVDYPIAFNILENVDPRYKHLVASGLMGVFTKIWANVWSARMEYILSNCILALLDSPGNTLLGINRVLVDKVYRHKIVSRITDPIVRSFWVNEYANYSDKFRTEAIAPIQNKVGQFLSTSIVRNIVGQTKSTIDLREIMDNKKILILNLSKGRIGEDNSALLGAMMITKLQVAAMSRVDVPESEREDFFLYVDEFQNFATTSFKDILSEARKYRLSLIMAHQYIEQLDEEVAAAVFGNVGTISCFRVGATDAEELVKEFTPYFTEEDLVNLTKFEIYLRLMINGVASKPFSASSLPPLRNDEKTGNKETMIAVSHERYSRPRAEVEEKIIRWTGIEEMGAEVARDMNTSGVPEEDTRYREGFVATTKPPAPLPPVPENEARPRAPIPLAVDLIPRPAASAAGYRQDGDTEGVSPPRVPTRGFFPVVRDNLNSPPSRPLPADEPSQGAKEATCDNCGKGTLVVFEPDDKRNVFCKKCLKLFKKGLIDVTKLKKKNIIEKYDDLPPLVATGQGIQIASSPQAQEPVTQSAPMQTRAPQPAHMTRAPARTPETPIQVKRNVAQPAAHPRPRAEPPKVIRTENFALPTHAANAPVITTPPQPISLQEALRQPPVSFHPPRPPRTQGSFNSPRASTKERIEAHTAEEAPRVAGKILSVSSTPARMSPSSTSVNKKTPTDDVRHETSLTRSAPTPGDTQPVIEEGIPPIAAHRGNAAKTHTQPDTGVPQETPEKLEEGVKQAGFIPLSPRQTNQAEDKTQEGQREDHSQGEAYRAGTGFIRGLPPRKVVSFRPQGDT